MMLVIADAAPDAAFMPERHAIAFAAMPPFIVLH